MLRAVTVYCSSSTSLDDHFHDVARVVGEAIAQRGLDLVYGGGSIGLMGEISSAARAGGGRVIGVITQSLVEKERADRDCDELIIVETLRERKRIMAERGDAFIVLPGGIGTWEEFFEVLVGRKLGEHDKPIGIVNAHGYYDPLSAMIAHSVDHRFNNSDVHDLFVMSADPMEVIEALGMGQAAMGTRQ